MEFRRVLFRSKGDRALFYHSQIGLEAVGIMEVVEEAGPDSTDSSGRWVAVHVAPKTKLPRGVSLKEMKADPALADMKMLRQGRLSVAPLTKAEYEHILAMAERRSEEHTSELQSLMRTSYAVFCLKK